MIKQWLAAQTDRENNGENAWERRIWPRGRYRNGWNLEFQAIFDIHAWGFGMNARRDPGDCSLGIELGPFWLGLHGFKVSVVR
jgi:hypothetical protein